LNSTAETTVSKKSVDSRRRLKDYWLELSLSGAMIGFTVYALISTSYFVTGEFSYNSLIHYGSCFVLASFFLNRQRVAIIDRVLYSLAIMASGIVLYEIVYHYGFAISPSIVMQNASFFGLDSGNGTFPLDWFAIILVIPFAWRQYMRLNKSLVILIIAETIVMLGWISIGYPQPQFPTWPPAHSPIFHLIPLVNGTPDIGSTIFYGMLFSGMAKTISVIPAFLFNKK